MKMAKIGRKALNEAQSLARKAVYATDTRNPASMWVAAMNKLKEAYGKC